MTLDDLFTLLELPLHNIAVKHIVNQPISFPLQNDSKWFPFVI